ncbi:hypothetical protein [Rurimicrobium arvi]|uniref:Transposase n=1 Tax=Rurimicrobium arvi TaxID=2049916 RepID=A0ABP8MIJ4_9BACT
MAFERFRSFDAFQKIKLCLNRVYYQVEFVATRYIPAPETKYGQVKTQQPA